jgi:PAS domain S-box-containing protein
VNKQAEVLLGRPRDELIGAHQTELHPPGRGSQYRERFRRHVERGQAANYVGEVVRKDESIVPVMISAGTFTVGKESFIPGLFHDVTERRRIEGKLRRSQRELRKLAAYLQSVREEERLEVARTIHDELGQRLTALKMDVSWLARRLPKGAKELREKARDMALFIEVTARTIERISTELRPPLLDDLGLAAAAEWYVEDFQKHSGINCEVDVSAGDVVLGRGPATAVFRILQEALRNVVRHAKATKVKVSLRTSGGKTVLKVRDNGIGIARERLADSQAFGLLGMRERALSLGGSVRIRGRPGKGTTVTVTVPPSKGQGH